jgi:hypothetical protein
MNSIGVAFSVAEMKKLDVGRGGAQEDEAKGSRTSTSRGDAAGKQLRGDRARARLCPLCGRRDRGAPDPHRVTVASFIQLVLWFCKIRPNFKLKTKFHQNGSCAEFYKLQNSFW